MPTSTAVTIGMGRQPSWAAVTAWPAGQLEQPVELERAYVSAGHGWQTVAAPGPQEAPKPSLLKNVCSVCLFCGPVDLMPRF